MKAAHLTTVDLSLRYLVFPQLEAIAEAGGESIGISADGPDVPYLTAAGIRHIPLRSSTRGMDPLADLKAAWELWRILRRERLDVLHTHNPKPGLYGRILGRLAGVPIIVNTVHGLYATPDDRLAKRAAVYTLEALAARFSDAELVQSVEDFELMTRRGISPSSRTFHLGNGIDLTRFDPERFSAADRTVLRNEWGAGDDDIVVGIVGRLVAEKGYPELFTAAAELDGRYKVVCVGPHDPEKADALAEPQLRAAEEQGVELLGMRTDVDALYNAMDIFVLPSHREGFPRGAMEAAAMGLPVIATDIRGCREVVEHGVNGLLVPVRDPQALAAAIRRLGEHDDERSEMGSAGRARAKERFDERKVVETVMDAYRRVAARKGLAHFEPDFDGIRIRPAVREDVAGLARLHSDGISTGFLPRLGLRFMRRLYRALVDYEDGVVLVADDGTGAVGFVAGVASTGSFYRWFIRRHGIQAGIAALPRLLRPSMVRQAFETLRYDGGQTTVNAELLATAVRAAARGRGVGTRLGNEFLDRLRAKGTEKVKVVVGADNAPAIASYHRMGFVDADKIEVHAGEESVLLVWSA